MCFNYNVLHSHPMNMEIKSIFFVIIINYTCKWICTYMHVHLKMFSSLEETWMFLENI